ncbi:alginate lyase family protein [Pararoseomonas indoligenes]|uniref:Alginate lyase family protein n=1 Tax=Roseomonas indoligenes TaxID=2820811 RepID=A0A940MW64_9PROT|nr:alginate lyase family protein [Pararoseomonas indoligenes]MBP0491611.1 alginate lyase family protein [Pararoseomonas indoligenes]
MPSRRRAVLVAPALLALLPGAGLAQPGAQNRRGPPPANPPPIGPRVERRRLVGPFRPAPAPTGENATCEPVGRPVRNLEGFGYFLDPASSRPDPSRLAMDEAAAKPMWDWLAVVQRAVAAHRAGKAGAAACAMESMDVWARNDALLGAFNLQASYHRVLILAGASLSYLGVREASGLVPSRADRVARWLAAIANEARTRYDRRSEALISDTRNHQAAWAGLAAASAGVAAGDTLLLDWGMGKLRAQLAQVDERGALPQELRRAGLALRSHLLALEAVAALERLGAPNGAVLTEAERAAYRRLRDFCLAHVREPAKMQALVGVAQSDPWLGDAPPLSRAAGLEIAAAAMPDPETEAALAPFRPLSEPRLGGEVTGWWRAAPTPPGEGDREGSPSPPAR